MVAEMHSVADPAAPTEPLTASEWTAFAQRLQSDDIPIGFAIIDSDLRFQLASRVVAEIDGTPERSHLGRAILDAIPAFPETGLDPFRRVLRTGQPLLGIEFSGAVVNPAAPPRRWTANLHPIAAPDGGTIGIAVLVWEVSDHRPRRDATARTALEAAARRLRLLQRLTMTLASTTDSGHMAQVVTTAVREAIGNQTGLILGFDGSRTRLLGSVGLPEPAAERLRAGGDVTPLMGGAFRPVLVPGRQVVFWGSDEERASRYPSLDPPAEGFEAWTIITLLVRSEPIGIVAFGWRQRHTFESSEIDLLISVADQTAAALDRVRMFDAEHRALRAAQRAQRRLALMAQVSAELAEAVSETEQLHCLADLLINSGFAGSFDAHLLDARGRLVRRVLRIRRPEMHAVEEALAGAPMRADDPRVAVWETGQPMFTALPDLSVYLPSRHGRLFAESIAHLSDHSALAVPLVARGQRLGLFTVAREASEGPYRPEDLQLLVDVGRRAGTAIDNVRLLAEQTRIATRLQETLLPAKLPSIEGVDLAAGYRVAEDTAYIGGDFYDVFAVDDGYALVIGDVVGHGIDAAGLTGTARSTLRALAGHLPPPVMLAHLNTILAEQAGNERFLTLAYLALQTRPDHIELRVWLAGHPRPLVARADGTVTEIGVPGQILGILPEVTHTEHVCRLDPGDLLLLYTDGLSEARGPDGLFGTVRLPALLASLAGRTAADAAARIEQAVIDYRADSRADDTTFLTIRSAQPVDVGRVASGRRPTSSGVPVTMPPSVTLSPPVALRPPVTLCQPVALPPPPVGPPAGVGSPPLGASPPGLVVLDHRLPAELSAAGQVHDAVTAAVGSVLVPEALDEILAAIDDLLAGAFRTPRAEPAACSSTDPVQLRITAAGDALRVLVRGRPRPNSVLPSPRGATGQADCLRRAVISEGGVTAHDGMTCAWFTSRGVVLDDAPVHETFAQAFAAVDAGAVPVGHTIHARFAATPVAARDARRMIEAACRCWGVEQVTDLATLVLTELVSNAVQHAGTDLQTSVALRNGHLSLSVRDGSLQPPKLTPIEVPGDGSCRELSERGRGLHLIDACAAAWGFNPMPPGKTVWAILRPPTVCAIPAAVHTAAP